MNTFLQGCCFIAPEDDNISTPTFGEHFPQCIPSSRCSSSKSNYELRSKGSKEIFYIKRFPIEAWGDFDEESTLMSMRSLTSLEVSHGSTRSMSEPKMRKNCFSTNPLLPEQTDNENMSYWLCTNPQQSMESSHYMPAYGPKTPRRRTTSLSRLLDFISMCFWKCSPGCQQIPIIHT